MRLMRLLATVALIAASLAPAAAADLKPRPLLKAPAPAPPSAFWIGAEYLLWSAKGDKLPPLVTTSPPGTPLAQAGVLGGPGTSVLFGDASTNDRWRSGARVRAGYWLDPQHSSGIEASVFILDRTSSGFAASSSGTPILAQPFFDVLAGLPNAILIAFPGVSSGSIGISDPSRLFGAGADYRRELCRSCALGSVSALVGYRFLWLRDKLAIDSTAVAAGSSATPAGTIFATTDQFTTSNFFHGLDLGLTGEVGNGPWTLTWTAKLALGATVADVDINGDLTTTLPGAAPVTTAGGFYALPTNSGGFSSARFAISPELTAQLGYDVSPNVRVFAGYSLLYWTGLVRPGGTIDTTINTSQLGGLPLAGPARPLPQSNTTDYWAQGLNLGATYRF